MFWVERYRFNVRYRCTDHLSPVPTAGCVRHRFVKFVGLFRNENSNFKTAQRISSYYGHADWTIVRDFLFSFAFLRFTTRIDVATMLLEQRRALSESRQPCSLATGCPIFNIHPKWSETIAQMSLRQNRTGWLCVSVCVPCWTFKRSLFLLISRFVFFNASTHECASCLMPFHARNFTNSSVDVETLKWIDFLRYWVAQFANVSPWDQVIPRVSRSPPASSSFLPGWLVFRDHSAT